jgi:hypothetical protein
MPHAFRQVSIPASCTVSASTVTSAQNQRVTVLDAAHLGPSGASVAWLFGVLAATTSICVRASRYGSIWPWPRAVDLDERGALIREVRNAAAALLTALDEPLRPACTDACLLATRLSPSALTNARCGILLLHGLALPPASSNFSSKREFQDQARCAARSAAGVG